MKKCTQACIFLSVQTVPSTNLGHAHQALRVQGLGARFKLACLVNWAA